MSYPRILCQKSKLFHFILNLCLLNPFQLHDIPVFHKEKKLLSCIGMTSFFVSYSSLSFQQPTETGRCQKILDSESLQCRHPPRLEQPHYCKLTSSNLKHLFFFFATQSEKISILCSHPSVLFVKQESEEIGETSKQGKIYVLAA